MNVLICDDRIENALQCEKKLSQIAQKHQIPIKTKFFHQSSGLLFEMENTFTSIDLIYLDIQTSQKGGLQTAITLRQMGYTGDIVFCSTTPDCAMEGYDVSALHYIVKNMTPDKKFEEIFLRACKRKQSREQEVLILTCAGESRCIPVLQIRYISVSQQILTVHYLKDSFEFYSTMMRMEDQLFGKGFVRAHKSFLINTHWIFSIDRNNVVLRTGEILPVGKKYYGKAIEKLEAGAP